MPSAVCPYCHETAYSNAEFTEPWTCPSCRKAIIPKGLPRPEVKHLTEADAAVIEQYSHYWTRQ